MYVQPFSVRGAAEDYLLTLAQGIAGDATPVTIAHPRSLEIGPNDAGIGMSPFEDQRTSDLGYLRRTLLALEPDIVHVNQVFLPALAALMGSRVPLVVTNHTPSLPTSLSYRGRALDLVGRARVDAWVVLSDTNRRLAAERWHRGRIAVVPPGLPTERFADGLGQEDARAALGLPVDGLVVGSVGRLSHQKRHDVLIEATARASRGVEGVHLAILGEGELRSRTAALGAAALPGRFHLPGHRTDVPRVLPAFDVFAMSSDFEGLPFALLEAMAVGLPIVSTDVQGAGEAIRHEQDGLLVPRRDPVAFGDAIGRLLRDRELAARLGASAKERFLTEYTAERMVSRTEALYRDLLARRRR